MPTRDNTPSTDANTKYADRKALLGRLHHWAALIASPFALMAVLTGIFYVFTPQIENLLYAKLDRVTPAGSVRTLDEAVAAASLAAPAGWRLHSALPAKDINSATQINFAPPPTQSNESKSHNHGSRQTSNKARPSFLLPEEAVVVYVNPYTAQVIGTLPLQERFNLWAKKLHSRLLQSENWRWMIELAASWIMVLLVTGVWLGWSQLRARKSLPSGIKRKQWRHWHILIGLSLSLVSLSILATGLTWSKYSGAQIRIFRDSIGQAAPKPPRGLQSIALQGKEPLSWQALLDAARTQAPQVALQLTPPTSSSDVWRINSADRAQPRQSFDMQLDAYSGKQLYYSGWDKQTLFGQATAIGIPFHRGEFGWWNQALLLIFGFGLLFSITSGWLMFFKRQRPSLLPRPQLRTGAWKSIPLAAWLLIGTMLIAMPLLALSASVVLLVEVLIHRPWQGAAKH